MSNQFDFLQFFSSPGQSSIAKKAIMLVPKVQLGTENEIPAMLFTNEAVITRKYPLQGYNLGVLTHTTALERHSGGDETLK